MPHRCAFGCKDTSTVMHSFPNPGKFPERFKAWVNLIGSNLETLTDYDIYKKKRICDIHFTVEHRNRYKRLNALAMPTLYLPGDHLYDHTYSKKEDIEEVAENPVVVPEDPVDHLYSTPATNPPASPTDFTTLDESESSEMPSTSECEQSSHNVQTGSLTTQDFTTFEIFGSSEIPSTSKCEQSSHNIQIGSLTSKDFTTFEVFESSEMPSTSECEQSSHTIQIGSLGSRGQGILIRPHTQNSEEYIGFDVLVPRKNKTTTILVL